MPGRRPWVAGHFGCSPASTMVTVVVASLGCGGNKGCSGGQLGRVSSGAWIWIGFLFAYALRPSSCHGGGNERKLMTAATPVGNVILLGTSSW